MTKFDGQIDLDEVYEILRQFKAPFIKVAQQVHGQNEESKTVTEPWQFNRIATLLGLQNEGMEFSQNL